PEERVGLTAARLCQAHDRAVVVHVVRNAGRPRPPQAAQVDHTAGIRDQEGVLHDGPGDPTVPCHLSPPIHGERLALVPPQRAELVDRDYRRPSCFEAHSPACTAVSAVGPSKRCTRMAGRPLRLIATMWKIET